MDIALSLSLLSLIAVVILSLELALGIRRLAFLRDLPLPPSGTLPLVSVVIPACNEEATIGPALATVLALDYPALEIIVVNDRSTDGTGRVLAGMGLAPRLRVITVDELPAGWLGKSHAMQVAAEQARGEYLLFTDADIHLQATALARAVQRMQEKDRDHLAVFFETQGGSNLLRAMMLELCGGLFWFLKPWSAVDPQSPRFIGVGAFNLVKTEVYRRLGGHRAIALCPVDDIMLGKLLKKGGARQEFLAGQGMVRVAWYGSVGGMIRGVTKNTFAALEYSLARLLGLTCLQLLVGVWPLAALGGVSGPARTMAGLVLFLRLLSFMDGARRFSVPLRVTPWFLVTPLLSLYMTWRAVLLTLVTGGISWRGTFYPLEELRRNRLP